jgi:hypothetical protein
MWWVVGVAVAFYVVGTVVAGAVMRLGSDGKEPADPDPSEKVQRAFAAVHGRRPVAIATEQEGPVLIRGKVAPRREALTSPLSRRDCVYYDTRIDDFGNLAPIPDAALAPNGPGIPTTAMLKRRDARSFLVTDDTGTALVAFDDLAEVVFVVPEHLYLTGRKLREAADVQQALFGLGVAPAGSIAVHEAAIFVGDEVTVAGVGRREVAPDGESSGYRSAPRRYVVRAAPDGLLGILKRKRGA